MKKLIIFILLVAGGYFAYEYLIKEKTVLEIKADKSISTQHSMDIDAPALAPAKFASVQGTVKNVSDKTVTNILLKYKLNAKPVEARIAGIYIQPGAAGVRKCWHGLGIRIEDNVAITKDGPRLLTEGLVRTPDEIEALMTA